jgi:outer membrane protein TolC
MNSTKKSGPRRRRARRGGGFVAGVAGLFLLLSALCSPAAAQQAPPQGEASPGEGPPPAELTLKSALERALKSSRELALARIRASVARRQANLTKARFQPNLFTGSGAVYTNGIPETPGGTAPSIFNMAYVQTLFNPPLRGQYREEALQAQIEDLQTSLTRDSVMVKTASTYLELIKVRHGLDLLRKEGDSSTRVLDITRQRVAEGQELPIEITRAELVSARVVERRLQLEGREDVLQANLQDLCSVAPDRHIDLVDTGQTPNFASAADRPLHELIALGVQNSLEIRQAELDYRAKQERLKGERGGRFPTVDLVAKYSLLSKINNYDQYFRTFQKNNVNVGLQINIPIFSARTSAAVELASADLHRSELELSATRSRIENEVRGQARRVRETEAAREVARLELKLAQEELQNLQAKFEEGHANLRDVEKLRLEESTKWLAFLDADFDNQQASLELLRMTGQLSTVLP